MFHTPAHKQTDPAKAPGQIVNESNPPRIRWLTQVRCRPEGAIGAFTKIYTCTVFGQDRQAAIENALTETRLHGFEPSHVQGCWREGRPLV